MCNLRTLEVGKQSLCWCTLVLVSPEPDTVTHQDRQTDGQMGLFDLGWISIDIYPA